MPLGKSKKTQRSFATVLVDFTLSRHSLGDFVVYLRLAPGEMKRSEKNEWRFRCVPKIGSRGNPKNNQPTKTSKTKM